MTIWVDAQLSPSVAEWINQRFPYTAIAVRDVGHRDSEDIDIFRAARDANAVVMTKDQDFVTLLDRFGPPPQVIWLTCGNTSNINLKRILDQTLDQAITMLKSGEAIIEINSV